MNVLFSYMFTSFFSWDFASACRFYSVLDLMTTLNSELTAYMSRSILFRKRDLNTSTINSEFSLCGHGTSAFRGPLLFLVYLLPLEHILSTFKDISSLSSHGWYSVLHFFKASWGSRTTCLAQLLRLCLMFLKGKTELICAPEKHTTLMETFHQEPLGIFGLMKYC